MTKFQKSLLLVFLILLIDQAVKIWIKTHMSLYQEYRVFDWFRIYFIENNGMAYGMTFINKLALSVFRIVAIGLIGWYIWHVVKRGGRTRYVIFLSMIAAGAAGNIFDSMLYGLVFTPSTPYSISYFVPFGSGYSDFLMGKVVDMFYFPIIQTTWPDWVPMFGGQEFIFFSPIFNFADACITVGVICLLLFCRKDWEDIDGKKTKKESKDTTVSQDAKA